MKRREDLSKGDAPSVAACGGNQDISVDPRILEPLPSTNLELDNDTAHSLTYPHTALDPCDDTLSSHGEWERSKVLHKALKRLHTTDTDPEGHHNHREATETPSSYSDAGVSRQSSKRGSGSRQNSSASVSPSELSHSMGQDDGEERPDGNDRKRRGVDKEQGASFLKLFACPYYQRNPNRRDRSCCSGPGFPSVSRVKEHLKRVHAIAVCPRCGESFPSRTVVDKHLGSEKPCQLRSTGRNEHRDWDRGYVESQGQQLKRKVRGTEDEKWRAVYLILFPDDGDIPSPYNEPQSKFLRSAMSELERRLSNTMRIELPSDMYRVVMDSVHSAIGDILRSPQFGQGRGTDDITETNDICSSPENTQSSLTESPLHPAKPPPGFPRSLTPEPPVPLASTDNMECQFDFPGFDHRYLKTDFLMEQQSWPTATEEDTSGFLWHLLPDSDAQGGLFCNSNSFSAELGDLVQP